MDPKNEQNRNSTLGLWHLNPIDIMRHGFTSINSSRFLVTFVWILFLNPLIYFQN